LRQSADQLKNKLGSGVVLVATVEGDNKVALVAGVTKDLTDRLKAGDLMRQAAGYVGGKGGGCGTDRPLHFVSCPSAPEA